MTDTNKKTSGSSIRIGIIIAVAVIAAFVIGLFIAGTFNFGQRNTMRGENPTASIETKYPVTTSEGTSPFVKVADMIIPTVVNISAEKVVKIQNPGFQFPFDDFFKDFFKDFPKQQAPLEQKSQATGSGVIISADGYILTNNHVIDGFDNFIVTLSDKTIFKAKKVKVVGKDSKTDLAVIKIESKDPLPYAKLGNSDAIRIGDWAIAVGNPFGLNGTVTVGVISAKGRSGVLPEGPQYQDFIQTDASINPGNSGGPLVNLNGEVIGINTAIRTTTGGNIGIGFATPINLAKDISDQLIHKGKIVRGYLGVRPQEVTQDIKEAMGLKNTEGVLIGEVLEKSAAAKAGLKDGDVIVKFDGKKVTDVEQFRRLVADYAPGTSVDIEVIRDSKSMAFTAKLEEMPGEVASSPSEEKPTETEEVKTWLGITVRKLTQDEKDNLKLEQGVMVDKVEAGSIADGAGINAGDVVLKIDKYDIATISDFSKVAREFKDAKKPVLFRLKRNNVSLYIAVTPE